MERRPFTVTDIIADHSAILRQQLSVRTEKQNLLQDIPLVSELLVSCSAARATSGLRAILKCGTASVAS